jgi:hypothetical protein
VGWRSKALLAFDASHLFYKEGTTKTGWNKSYTGKTVVPSEDILPQNG